MSERERRNLENLLNALPPPLQGDSIIQALAETAAEALADRAAETDWPRIYTRLDELPEELLDILAYDFKVDWWDPDYTLEEKRRVLRDSWYVHRHMGTRAAVETALKAVYRDATVLEWFEYGGKPGYFRLWTDVTNEDFVPALRREILRRMNYYKRLSAHLESAGYYMRAEPARAYAYLAYGGRAETRWGGIVQPPSVGPPKVWTTVIYGGVLSGMAGSAERTVAIPSEVKPPVTKPSLALAHFQFMNQIQRCWNGIVPPPDIGPPEVWTDAIYGGVLAGMAGSAKRTVSVPPEARPPVCGPSMVSARFQFMNQVQRCWNGIVPPPSAGPPKANAKAVFGGVLAGAAGSAKRKIKVPAEVGPPVCKPRCAAALVCHTALRGGMRGSGTALRGEAPRAGANAVYGGALAGMAGHMRMAKRGVELRI